MSNKPVKIVAKNRKARFDYHILETYEAGIVLHGTEVKSIRQGKANLAESYAVIENDEAFIRGMHVSPYEQGNRFNVDPLRKRKLLLNKREIFQLKSKTEADGHTLIPLSLYLKSGLVKLELAVAKGKKLYDKRDAIKKKEQDKEISRNLY